MAMVKILKSHDHITPCSPTNLGLSSIHRVLVWILAAELKCCSLALSEIFAVLYACTVCIFLNLRNSGADASEVIETDSN